MMNKEKVAFIGKFIVITVLVLNFLFIAASYFKLKTPAVSNEFTVNQKIHLECQKLSVQAGEGWSYKSCVDSIQNADRQEARILKTI